VYWIAVEIPEWTGQHLGVGRPIENHCESLLRCTLQKLITELQAEGGTTVPFWLKKNKK